jgi:hypothetical protein
MPPMPHAWTEAFDGADLVLTGRWRSLFSVVLVAWCVAWGYVVALAWVDDRLASLHVDAWRLLIPGLGMTWWMLASVLNRTTVRVKRGRIMVRHGPIPLLRSRDVRTAKVAQIFVRAGAVRILGRAHWHVCWSADDGRDEILVAHLPSLEHARWIERRIETHLSITDASVPGEAH